MKAKDKSKLEKVIGGLFIAAVLLNQMGFLGTRFDFRQLFNLGQPTPPPSTTAISGILTTNVAAYDSLDIATARTIPTNVIVYWYAYRGGWVLLGSGTAQDLSILKDDANSIYAVLSVPSGQNYYVDYQKTMEMNSRIKSVEWKDITGDSIREYVMRMDISDSPYASGTGKYNMPLFIAYLLNYDNAFSWPAGGKPADVTTVGTAAVTKYCEWYWSLSAEKKSMAISKIVVSINNSDSSKCTLKKVNIPGIGYIDGSNFEQDVLTTETKWTYAVSKTLYGADYVKLPVGTNNKFDWTVSVQFNLASGDFINLTLTVYYFDGAEALKSTTDTVKFSA